jgi:hypothetical protein
MTQSNIPRGLSTREIADFMQVTAEGIRVQLCRTGSYYGLTPARLPNNRLLWPADSLERLLAAGRRTKPRTPPGPRSRRNAEGVARD